MDLLYIWHDYKYWSKILFSTIPTPACDLEGKVMDLKDVMLKFCIKVFKLKFCIKVFKIS